MVMSEAPHPSLPSLGDTTVTLVTGDVSLPRALEGVRGGSWLRARPNGQLGQAKPHRASRGTWAPESQQERSGHPREARPPNARAVEAGAVGARRMSRARPGAAAGTASSPGSPRGCRDNSPSGGTWDIVKTGGNRTQWAAFLYKISSSLNLDGNYGRQAMAITAQFCPDHLCDLRLLPHALSLPALLVTNGKVARSLYIIRRLARRLGRL